MNIQSLHSWDVDPRTAADIQRDLAARVIARDEVAHEPRYVAGVDLSPPDANGEATAAAVLVELPNLSVVEVRLHQGRPTFPYVPGLLSFREAPLVLGALSMLSTAPDVILVDGHGMAHPRRFGLACHLGLLTGAPTVGCAKSILCGRPDGSPEPERGSHVPMVDRGEVVSAAVRTRASVNTHLRLRGTPDQPGAGRGVDSRLLQGLSYAGAHAAGPPRRRRTHRPSGRGRVGAPPSSNTNYGGRRPTMQDFKGRFQDLGERISHMMVRL